jgi:hypothetical protein
LQRAEVVDGHEITGTMMLRAGAAAMAPVITVSNGGRAWIRHIAEATWQSDGSFEGFEASGQPT